jgi:hypothetical protein
MQPIKHDLNVKADAQAAYRAIATSSGIKGWWAKDSDVGEAVGGKTELRFTKPNMSAVMKAGKQVVLRLGEDPRLAANVLFWKPCSPVVACVRQLGRWKSAESICRTPPGRPSRPGFSILSRRSVQPQGVRLERRDSSSRRLRRRLWHAGLDLRKHDRGAAGNRGPLCWI